MLKRSTPWSRVTLLSLAVCIMTSAASAATIYRETFGRPNNDGGDLPTTVFGWQDFLASGGANAVTANAGINGSQSGRPADVANVNAGANSDGTTGAYALGIHFYTTAAVGPILTYTPEYQVNPADYIPGSLVFSWYQGNQNTVDTMSLAIQVGGQWYALAAGFPNITSVSLAGFAANAQLNQVTFNPAAVNWLILNFNGSYDGGSPGTSVDSTVPLSLGGNPGSDLSGTITAFGLYIQGTTSTRRWDTFQIDAVLVPEPSAFAFIGMGLAGLIFSRRNRA
jgi:hypothetical protein